MLAVRRDIGKTRRPPRPRIGMFGHGAANSNSARHRPAHAGDALNEFVLPVALHAGEPNDLGPADEE